MSPRQHREAGLAAAAVSVRRPVMTAPGQATRCATRQSFPSTFAIRQSRWGETGAEPFADGLERARPCFWPASPVVRRQSGARGNMRQVHAFEVKRIMGVRGTVELPGEHSDGKAVGHSVHKRGEATPGLQPRALHRGGLLSPYLPWPGVSARAACDRRDRPGRGSGQCLGLSGVGPRRGKNLSHYPEAVGRSSTFSEAVIGHASAWACSVPTDLGREKRGIGGLSPWSVGAYFAPSGLLGPC